MPRYAVATSSKRYNSSATSWILAVKIIEAPTQEIAEAIERIRAEKEHPNHSVFLTNSTIVQEA